MSGINYNMMNTAKHPQAQVATYNPNTQVSLAQAKQYDPNVFSRQDWGSSAGSYSTPSTSTTTLTPTFNQPNQSVMQNVQGAYRKFMGNQNQNYSLAADGSMQTPEMQSMYAANPTATLSADGSWANADGSALKTPTASSAMSDIGGYAGLAQAGISLFNGINSYNLGKKNLSLAKDMFGFEKAATNRNMTNQATEYNTGVQNRGEVGMSLAGNTMDQSARDARQAQLNSYKLSTAPIG